jgi:carboxylesterase
VLCIHGFTGVPGDMQLATDAAADLELATHAPRLAGHGTRPEDLKSCRFSNWVDSMRPHLSAAADRGPVILVGLSLGSLVATQLTLEVPGTIAGLVLISNAFWLQRPHPALSLELAARLKLKDFAIPKSGPDLADPEARQAYVGYRLQPLHASISLLQAGQRLRQELFRIHCPTLFLHGADDHVTPVDNAWKAAARLGTRDSRVLIYPRSRHILTRDLDKTSVANDLRHFLQRIAGSIEKD